MNTHGTLTLTFILLIASITAISAVDCPDETTILNCSCQNYGPEFEFYCPQSNPAVVIEAKESIQAAQLTCQNQYDLDSLPNLEIGNIRLLIVKSCILNETQSILETFDFLGVNNVRELRYHDYDELQRFPYNSKHFEGLENLVNLTLKRGFGIQQNTFQHLSNLKRLEIQFNKLELQRGVFDGLPNLEVLSLEYNKIYRLDEGLFNGNGNLQVLWIAHNNILNISKGVFNGLNNLRVLSLQNNNISSLDPELFTLLPELTELDIGANPISRFPEGMLSGNVKLKAFGLRVNLNSLESLPENFLANLPQLRTVNVDHSKISHLPDSLFHQSTEIVELNLAYNRLTTIPKGLLSDQYQLRDFNLDHNLLEKIPDELLKNSRELTTLRLSNNRLQSLSGKVFSNLINLKKLHLENNRLQTIDHFTFSGNRGLEELYMQNNQLAFHATSFVHDELNIVDNDNTPFQFLENLHTLKLQNNSISAIYINWNINTPLKDLDLSNNKISVLQYTNLQFQKDISVNLSNNIISLVFIDFDQAMNKNNTKTNTINVDLSNNPLNCNCNALGFVKYVQDESLKTLQFNTDRLRCAEPENLRDTTVKELKTTDLKCMLLENCPEECSCDLRPVDYTIVVNCSGRNLAVIPELPQTSQIDGFHSIELHAEHNRLTKLPTSNLFGYDQVTQLHVRNNSIRRLVSENFPTNLSLLDVSQNQLQAIDDLTVEFLTRTSTISSIKLSYNPWSCKCNTSRLLNFIQRNQKRINDMSEVRCNGKDSPLGSITVNDLCNEDLTTVIVICIAIAVMGLTIGLLSTLFYRYQTEVKVWLFTHNLFLWLITEEELDRDKRYDAFISYSHLDEDFITEQLIPTLEKEPMNFKTCWHVRDFMPGEMIITQIIKSIEDSRRTVIVLSKNFLQSHWAKEEFRQAHVQSMEDNRVRVIIVIYDDIGDVDKLDAELKAYLKTNTYVKWGDPWFWDKLRYAMPHPLKIKGLEKDILLEHVNATAPKTI